MKHGVKLTALSVFVALSLTACGGSDSKSTDKVVEEVKFDFSANEMITNLSNDVIVAGYENLNVKADELYLSTQNLVQDPTQDNLLAAQKAWVAARSPWEQGESHIFGPIDQMSIDPHLDSWPLATTDLQAVLDNVTNINAEFILKMNDNVQGYHTMEFLLFGNGIESNEKQIADLTEAERDYLLATAEIFKGYTQELEDAWLLGITDDNGEKDTPYLETFKSANNNIYGSQLAVIEELINGMIGIVDEVGNGKIADPFGASADKADTSLVESQYSWNSLKDFSDNITGVLNVYNGEFSGQSDKQGLYDFIASGDKALADRVLTEIEQAITDIEAISGENDMPFRRAITDDAGRERVQKAVDSLSTLQTSLESDVVELVKKWSGK